MLLFCHSGPEPESNVFSNCYGAGCRIKSGMTNIDYTLLCRMTPFGKQETRNVLLMFGSPPPSSRGQALSEDDGWMPAKTCPCKGRAGMMKKTPRMLK